MIQETMMLKQRRWTWRCQITEDQNGDAEINNVGKNIAANEDGENSGDENIDAVKKWCGKNEAGHSNDDDKNNDAAHHNDSEKKFVRKNDDENDDTRNTDDGNNAG